MKVVEPTGHVWHYGPWKTEMAARYLLHALAVQAIHRGTLASQGGIK